MLSVEWVFPYLLYLMSTLPVFRLLLDHLVALSKLFFALAILSCVLKQIISKQKL